MPINNLPMAYQVLFEFYDLLRLESMRTRVMMTSATSGTSKFDTPHLAYKVAYRQS